MEILRPEKELTSIILDVFQLNGLLIQEGDKLTKDLNLTSARWKILGALSLTKTPMTASEIARFMGQTRQAVQRLTNEMESDGFLYFKTNPHHKRAKLIALTQKGENYYELLEQRQVPWASSLAEGITIQEMETTAKVLKAIMNNIGR